MSDYAEGDYVEVVKGRTRISGVLSTDFSGLRIADAGWSIESLKYEGFTVTTIERAKPALPTEPGFYLTDYFYPDVFELNADGNWYYGDDVIAVERVIYDGGNRLTRLAPEPETAKKVLDRVETYLKSTVAIAALGDLRREFGVTGDAS